LEKLAEVEEKYHYDKFNQDTFLKIQSIQDLEQYANKLESDSNKISYWNNVDMLLRNRFYHGFSAYSFKENWIAAVLGYFYSPNIYFQYTVLPEDIMKYPMAGCSQQGIVLQTLFRKKGINYKTIQFNAHYAVAGKIEGRWYFFDTNIEPTFKNGKRPSVDKLDNFEYVEDIYPQLSNEEVERVLGKPQLSEDNPQLATNMAIFHKISYFISKSLWFFCFLGFLLCLKLNKVKIFK
jgi:hypothetical protein